MTNLTNNLKTASLLALMVAIFGIAGTAWGTGGMIIGLLLGGSGAAISFFFSDRIAIAAMRAQPLDPNEQRTIGGTSFSPAQLHAMTAELAERAGLPMPALYVCPHRAPNAFATGRSPKKAAVAVTVGLLEFMDHDEVEGVIAHELAHIKHRDTLISAVVAVMAGTLGVLAYWGFMLGANRNANPLVLIGAVLLSLIAAPLIKMAISRSREYAADREAAILVGSPRGLMSGLNKLDQLASRIPLDQPNPAQNNLFIVEPLTATKTLSNLFATHPPVEKRVAELAKLEA
ncbi:MAG: M48 family metalloprotease [Planctomycetota bacterium]